MEGKGFDLFDVGDDPVEKPSLDFLWTSRNPGVIPIKTTSRTHSSSESSRSPSPPLRAKKKSDSESSDEPVELSIVRKDKISLQKSNRGTSEEKAEEKVKEGNQEEEVEYSSDIFGFITKTTKGKLDKGSRESPSSKTKIRSRSNSSSGGSEANARLKSSHRSRSRSVSGERHSPYKKSDRYRDRRDRLQSEDSYRGGSRSTKDRRSGSRHRSAERKRRSLSRSKSRSRSPGRNRRRRDRSSDRYRRRSRDSYRDRSPRRRRSRGRGSPSHRRRRRSYERHGHSHRRRSSSRHRYRRRHRAHSSSRSRSRSRHSSKEKSKGGTSAATSSSGNKMGSLPLTTTATTMTPQMALQQTMAAMSAKAQALTGIELPKYYNPAAVNPLKYAEQVQKRKLLWQPKEATTEEPQKNTVWDKLTFSQDQDGKMTAKFRKLMGIKAEGMPEAEGNSHPEQKEVAPGLEDKQEELFRNLDQQYEVARMSTHTHRGVGLGYSAQIVFPPLQKP